MESNIFKTSLNKFENLNLTELNSKASLLKRIDRKFLLTSKEFKSILEDLKKDFRVLEISWKRVFDYYNVYMDTEDHLFYKQHQEWLNPRTKIRTRLYKDADIAFFEYKHKLDGITRKYRYEFPVMEHWIMTKEKRRFFEWIWQSIHDWKKAPKIFPAIQTTYKRITLVSKVWEERLTIDFSIKTKNIRNKFQEEVDLKNLVIIEWKSIGKKSKTLDLMKKHKIPQARGCSKYSLGVIYSGLAEKYDRFVNTMKKIKEIRVETLWNRRREQNMKKFDETTQFIRKDLQKVSFINKFKKTRLI